MSAADHPQTTAEQSQSRILAGLFRLKQMLMRRLWYVHPGAHLRVTISPDYAFYLLVNAAQPSIRRLHLRGVFARGRRYFLSRDDKGFRMVTTNKIFWRRRRTSASAILYCDFELIGESMTRLYLRSHIRILYLLQAFFLPTFMASMLIFMAWPVWVIALCIVMLYALSWIAHRYNAALEAYEMVFFIEKALEDYVPDPPPVLPGKSADVVYEGDFAAAWDKFVEDRQDD